MRDTILSIRLAQRDLRALQALAAIMSMSKGELLRLALKELAIKRGVWNVSDEQALPVFASTEKEN
mgnify:FL=1